MASLSPSPKMQFFDANGNPLVGGKLYTYVAGGFTVPQATYTDSTGITPNTNPIILDSRGEANVWMTDGLLYALKLTDSLDSLIWTADNIGGILSAASIHNATSKITPVDADEIPLSDSAASFSLKKLTWGNLKNTLSSTFASLAGSISQTFNVAAASAAEHAVRADQLPYQSITFFATTGTSSAYLLGANPSIATYAEGLTFEIEFHLANAANPTLSINGLIATSIKRELPGGTLVSLDANELAQYSIHRVTYDATNACFLVRDCKAKRTKVISATRDMTAVNGNVVYTGVGFKPSKITAYSAVAATRMKSIGMGSVGNVSCAFSGITSGYDNVLAKLIFQASSTAGASQDATISSIDSDGFTLSWTKIATPAAETATIRFFCEE